MSKEEESVVNLLLSMLRSFQVVSLVNEHYLQYNNSSPAQLLQKQINLVTELLIKK